MLTAEVKYTIVTSPGNITSGMYVTTSIGLRWQEDEMQNPGMCPYHPTRGKSDVEEGEGTEGEASMNTRRTESFGELTPHPFNLWGLGNSQAPTMDHLTQFLRIIKNDDTYN